MAVTPGSDASAVDVRVALHDGHVSRSTEGSAAEHQGHRKAGEAAPDVGSSAMAGMLACRCSVGIPQLTAPHSHSIVAGGFELMSYTTRLTPATSLTMRDEILPRTS